MNAITITKINKRGNCVCGFDLEYGSVGQPQLITVAVTEHVFLVRLNKEGKELFNGEKIPQVLVEFLTNKNFKVGVGIKGK